MNDLHERKLHGQPDFPFVVYRGNLPEYITGYPLHWHEEMELIYVVSGMGSIVVRAERFMVKAGDIVLLPPQSVHGIEQLEEMPMEYFNILFRPSLLDPLRIGEVYHCSDYHISRGTPLNEAISPHLESLIRNRKQRTAEYPLLVLSHLYAIVYHILSMQQKRPERENRHRESYDRLKVVLEYVQEQYAVPVTVEQAASMCGFSTSHFMKLFRELTGTSFTQYVKQQRLEAAAKLLRETGKRISEIADEVGFHNLSYFTRAFEERFRDSPSVYRINQ